MIRTIQIFSIFLILNLLLNSCKTDHSAQTEEAFIKELFQVLAQDNYDLFEEKFLPDHDFVIHIEEEFTKLKGLTFDPTQAENKYKIIKRNGHKVYKKLTQRKIGQGREDQLTKVDWSNVKIKKISPKFHVIGDVLGGELLVDINNKGIDCGIKFRGVYKRGNSHWKIVNYIDYVNCADAPINNLAK